MGHTLTGMGLDVPGAGGNAFESFFNALMAEHGAYVVGLDDDGAGGLATSRNTALAYPETRNVVLVPAFAADASWTKGTGWSITPGVGAIHAAGTASDLEQTVPFRAGKAEVVTIEHTLTAGSLTPKVGGTAGSPITTSGEHIQTIEAGSSNSLLELTASADYDGTVTLVTMQRESIPANDPNMYGTVTGATPGQATGLAAVPWAYLFDGVNDKITLLSSELNSFFNQMAGTIVYLHKPPDAAFWTEGLDREYLILWSTVSSNIRIRKLASGVASMKWTAVHEIQVTTTPTNFYLSALRWTASSLKYQVDGIDGAPLAVVPPAITNLTQVDFGFGSTYLPGLAAYMALFRAELSDAELLRMRQLAGVA